ncbi:MAG: hypothetical protein AAF414_15950, partial [Pseudomonadota bacterium]
VGAAGLAIAGVALLIFALAGLGLAWIVAGVVIFVAAMGLVETNAIVAALSVLPEENGTVSALTGALQFAIGALASLAVSLMASADAVPMTSVMAASGVLTLASAAFLRSTTLAHGASNA